jgi:hypothetical protein
VIYAGASMAIRKLHHTPAIMGSVIALGFVAAGVVGRGAQPLRLWIDRRFFRDAYNAEQILTELSEKVRTIVETQALLETVSCRIAESLHVSRLAVFLDGSGQYGLAYTLGFSEKPAVAFAERDATIQQLRSQRRPASVRLEDDHSWVNSVNPQDSAGIWARSRANCCCLRPPRKSCSGSSAWARNLQKNRTPAAMCACLPPWRRRQAWHSKWRG